MFGILRSVLKLVTSTKGETVAEGQYNVSGSTDIHEKIFYNEKSFSFTKDLDFDENIVEKIEEEVYAIECEEDDVDVNEEEKENVLIEEKENVLIEEKENVLIEEKETCLKHSKATELVDHKDVGSKTPQDSEGIFEDDRFELCHHRTGSITKLSKQQGIIDGKFSFVCKSLQFSKLREGMSVKYVVFRRHVNENWQLHKILSTDDENWEDNDEERKSEIIKKSGAISRKIIGQVEKIIDQEVLIKPNIKLSLSKITSGFLPREGDWLSISALVELDENVQDFVGDVLCVDDVQPLRSKTTSGSVTSWDENRNEGVIDKNIWFSLFVCEPSFSPAIGEAVSVEAIESSCGTCSWRALSVASLVKKEEQSPSYKIIETSRKRNSEPPCIKNGISVPRTIHIGCVDFGKSKEESIELCNLGKNNHILVRCRLQGKRSESQLTLLSKIDDGTTIGSGQKMFCHFKIQGKFLGEFKETLVFTFKGFKMISFIHYEIKDKHMMDLIPRTLSHSGKIQDKYSRMRDRLMKAESRVYLKGEFPRRPPSFVPVKLGIYPVPEKLWKAVLGEHDGDKYTSKVSRIGEIVPSLGTELNQNNYITRFHTLLHLEEIEMNIQLRKYDMQEVTFSPVAGEYLSLEIPGIAEKRPSVLVGDRVNVELSSDSGSVYEGFVHKISGNEVWFKFHNQFHKRYELEKCSLQFVVSRGPIRKCHAAIDLAWEHLGEQILFPTSVIVKEPQVVLNNIELLAKPFDMYKNGEASFVARNIKYPKPALDDNNTLLYPEHGKQFFSLLPPPKKPDKPVQLKWFNSRLNQYQKSAVLNVLKGEARPLPYVIFGPPGTGKTITLVETILQLYSVIPESRILVATPSNSSANVIAERLLISNHLLPGDLVRLVAWHCMEEGSVPEILLPYTTVCDINSPKVGENSPFSYKLKKSSNALVLGRHRITVGTCVALGHLYTMGFPSGHFTHVCVDEAGQATEPEILIPLALLHRDWGQAILAGDPLQLGPVVCSRLCVDYGLGYSFLARLLNSSPYQRDVDLFSKNGGFNPLLVTRLIMNYRSLPEILTLPSTLFYDSQLLPQIQEESLEGSILKSLKNFLPSRDSIFPPSLVFHGVRGHNYRESDDPSWFNPEELVQVLHYLKDFFEAGLTADDIGVITPYRKQVQKLRSLLNQVDLPVPKIGSVEEFQGQERMVIIFSAVRSSNHTALNIRYLLGFVASPQRLNVAITRARALLIITGNPHLLQHDPYWKKTLAYCIEQNAYVGCNVPNDFRVSLSLSDTEEE